MTSVNVGHQTLSFSFFNSEDRGPEVYRSLPEVTCLNPRRAGNFLLCQTPHLQAGSTTPKRVLQALSQFVLQSVAKAVVGGYSIAVSVRMIDATMSNRTSLCKEYISTVPLFPCQQHVSLGSSETFSQSKITQWVLSRLQLNYRHSRS